MVNKLKYRVNTLNFQPPWLIFLIDGSFSFVSALFVFLFLNKVQSGFAVAFIPALIKFLFAGMISTLITKSYRGVIRHTSFEDILGLTRTLVLQFSFLFVLEIFTFFSTKYIASGILAFYSFSSLLCLFLFFNYRLAVRYVFFFSRRISDGPIKTGIFGAGESGILLMNFLKSEKKHKSSVVVFFDDEARKFDKVIKGIPVVDAASMEEYAKKFSLDQIIVSPKFISNKRKTELFEVSKKIGVELKIIPNNDSWFVGKKEPENLHNIEILDLLGREQITTDNSRISALITGKSILVTGAAGSIGSELCRQIIAENPSRLIVLDQAESPLYEITLELKKDYPHVRITQFLCDVANENRLQQVFGSNRIDIVFHAAAYKHVPMQEQYPYEAVYCNVKGTVNLANLSVASGVDKFIMISTDKAVNPTNIMGATKRAAEIYTQSLNHVSAPKCKTQFITTRFGNVLGSNGSVVPLFKKQIAAGGPVTLTHPEITRYFMTISEASNLVLEAAAMGTGGEIFVFDMGTPVKIKDLAEKMIQLSGKDVNVEFTGLREGEKLYEELLANGENTRPTHNKKIMIATVREYDHNEVAERLNNIFLSMQLMDETAMVRGLKKLIPEFKSNQSRFCSLDAELGSEASVSREEAGYTAVYMNKFIDPVRRV